MILEELFTFPIVLVDADNEERKSKSKERFGSLPTEEEAQEYDMVFGEACYPYWDFLGIEDRWLPSTKSFEKAMNGRFEGCIVRFLHAGQILVPWSKKKFKEELKKFAEAYELSHPKMQEVKVETITSEQLKKEMGKDG